MRTRHSSIVAAALVALAAASSTQAEELTGSHTVSYVIHAAANDPNSPATFEVTLSLEAQAQAGDTVGWAVNWSRPRRR